MDGELQVTNSFPFPSADPAASSGDFNDNSSANAAAAAPRAKANAFYQAEMMRCLREMNVDANSVGWYQSANLGNFVCSQLLYCNKKVSPREGDYEGSWRNDETDILSCS